MNLIERIQYEMSTDTEDWEDQSERLEQIYLKAPRETRDVLDDALICICGYSFRTLLNV